MNSPTVRLFAAIDLDSRARDAISAEQRRIARGAGHSLRFVKAEQLHLTLAFMAAVEQERAAAIALAIERGFAQPPFEIRFSTLGVLPPQGRPRVLFVDIVKGASDVVALQEAVAARLREHGIELEDRPFRPHLTLARWRDGRPADARRVLSAESNLRIDQRVSAVTLYQSNLSSNGASHTPLARGALGPR